jgi:hypothetical protein
MGSHADNVNDKMAKGRHGSPGKVNIGERNGLAKLTSQDVREIRSITGKPLREIADQFGVGISAVHSIRKGHTWKHI